ncbi:hypothetical protein GOP47_0008608 [Adiantum capillus-veneris]|uniref:SBP-type domain-containing protein n=1 Tax=Adiantum capillus-veneris TaxID=13818 RepID=A0A9D4UYX6_ADICA|nr:hypothetical protein GOP47_0008608 [Adiantum capillus-veneris]
MAWDPSSTPWDWGTDGVIVPNHVYGMDSRRLPLADLACEADLSQIKHDGSLSQGSGAFCSSEVRHRSSIPESAQISTARDGDLLTSRVVSPAMSNIHGHRLVVNDEESLSNIGFLVQGRVPAVSTCVRSGTFIGGSDHGNGSLESVVQKRLGDKQGSAGNKNTQGIAALDNGRSFEKKSKMGLQCLNPSAEKRCDSNGRHHLATLKHLSDKSMGSICSVENATLIDEQHSSTARGSPGSGDSLTGLQLGKRTYSVDVAAPAETKAKIKLPAVGKKPRGGSHAVQVPRCQVEGCKLDLSAAKDYHRRHKVCEPHSKAGKVVVASVEQRFCQQCSRFHILTEFDETKRSCRRRLAGHNKRRRKPQPDPLELQARLRSSIEDWPFFYQSRISRLPFWQDAGESHSSMLWPRKLMQYHEQPSFDYSGGMDMIIKGLSPSQTHDKFPLVLLQSPKMLMYPSSCDPSVQDFVPGLVGNGTLGNGLSLSSSTIGAGVFTGFETTPVTDVTRVSDDSGRALSLLSLHPQCSQAPDMVSLDLSGLANTTVNHNLHMQDANVCSQQFHFQGQHVYCQDFSTALSISSNLYRPAAAAADVREEAHVMSSDKDLYECSFLNSSLNRHGGGYEENQHGSKCA